MRLPASLRGLLFTLALLAFTAADAATPPSPPPGSVVCANASLSASTSSARVALPSTNPNCQFVTFLNDGTDEVFIVFGGNTAVATTSGIALPGNRSISVWATGTYVAAITGANTTILRVMQSNGPIIIARRGSGSSPPPPLCSNSLDLSAACNSQYIGVLM